MRFSKALSTFAIFCVTIFSSFHTAHAVDLTGSWLLDTGVSNTTNSFQQIENVLTGTGTGNGHEWTIAGIITEPTIVFYAVSTDSTYVAQFDGTITDSDHMSGTWFDLNNQTGSWSATRQVGSGTKLSATDVSCRRGPNTNDSYRCMATVHSFDGTPPNPTGIVNFTSTMGSFPFGSSCTLQAQGSSQSESGCAVTLAQTPDSIPLGSVIPITALYGGDSVYDKSLSGQTIAGIERIPAKPKMCFSDTPTACDGVNAQMNNFDFTASTVRPTIHLSYFGPGSSRQAKLRTSSATSKGGQISILAQIIMKSKDNKSLSSTAPMKNLQDKLKNGLVLATTKVKLKFGASKDAVMKPSKSMPTVSAAARAANVSSMNLTLKMQVVRTGDTKPAIFNHKIKAVALGGH